MFRTLQHATLERDPVSSLLHLSWNLCHPESLELEELCTSPPSNASYEMNSSQGISGSCCSQLKGRQGITLLVNGKNRGRSLEEPGTDECLGMKYAAVCSDWQNFQQTHVSEERPICPMCLCFIHFSIQREATKKELWFKMCHENRKIYAKEKA